MVPSHLQPPSPPPRPPSLWSLLPSDLSDLILAHLSTAEAARVKPVCREWRSCVSSLWFERLQERAQGPRARQRLPSLLLYNHTVKISAITPAKIGGPSSSSSSSSSSSAAGPAHRTDLGLPSHYVREWVGHPVSGLLCIRTHFGTSSSITTPTQSSQFIVGNPFSGQWAPIPNPPPISMAIALSKLWAITANPSNHCHFWVLLLLLHTGGSLSLHLFSSEQAQWELIAIPALGSGIGSNGSGGSNGSNGSGNGSGGQVISFSSRAECVGEMIYAVDPESRSIVSVDVKKKKKKKEGGCCCCCIWRRLAWGLPEELVFEAAEAKPRLRLRFLDAPPKLIHGWNGRLLLVGAARRRSTSHRQQEETAMAGETAATETAETAMAGETVEMGVVWDRASSTEGFFWREVARVPRGMAEALAARAAESRKPSAAQAVRYAGLADEVVVMAMGSSRALRLDLMTERWEWLQLPDAVNCDLALSFAC